MEAAAEPSSAIVLVGHTSSKCLTMALLIQRFITSYLHDLSSSRMLVVSSKPGLGVALAALIKRVLLRVGQCMGLALSMSGHVRLVRMRFPGVAHCIA